MATKAAVKLLHHIHRLEVDETTIAANSLLIESPSMSNAYLGNKKKFIFFSYERHLMNLFSYPNSIK